MRGCCRMETGMGFLRLFSSLYMFYTGKFWQMFP